MSRKNYDAPAKRMAGASLVINVVNESILTQTQRDAYEKFRAYKRIDAEAEKTRAQALDEMRRACALMRRAGLPVRRIAELTGLSSGKVSVLVQHGDALLEGK